MSARSPRLSTLSLNLLLVGLTLWLRLIYPQSLPVFGDEGINIFWAQEFAQHHDTGYPVLMDGRFLFGVLLAGVGIYGPGPLRLGRTLVAVISTIGCAAAIGLGRRVGPRPVGALAGLLYAVLPYTLFHERQALTDPVMACVGALTVLWTLRLADSGQRRWIGLIAMAWAAAFLFKPSGVVYGLAPLLAVGILPTTRYQRWWLLVTGAGVVILATALTLGFLGALYPRLGVNDGRLAQQNLGFIQCPPIVCQLNGVEQWHQLQQVTPALPELLALDFGWPLVGLASLAWLLSPLRWRRRVFFLWAFAVGGLAFFLLAGRGQLVARYLSPLAVPLVTLGAVGFWGLIHRTGSRPRQWVTAVGLVLTLCASLTHTVVLIIRPELAPIPAFDRHQYFTGPVGGAAFQAAALDILAQEPYPFILTKHFMLNALASFFDPQQARIRHLWRVNWVETQTQLNQGGIIYLVDEVSPATASEPDHASTRFYPYQNGQSLIRVRLVDPSQPQANATLYNFIYDWPDELLSDYEALAQFLQSQPEPTRLVTYPSHQLALLNTLLPDTPTLQPYALGGTMPWEPVAVIDSLTEGVVEAEMVNVIFLEETRLDPHRQVETWLNTHLYRLTERWFGPLRWVAYAGGLTDMTSPIWSNVQFGEALMLETAEVVGTDLYAGGLVRFRLRWRATAPISRPYKMFLHIFDEQRIVAQYDSQPLGELRPTPTWSVGEEVVDQFAIRLPVEAPPGTYQFRLGWYDVETQARLSVTVNTDDPPAEFLVGGNLNIR